MINNKFSNKGRHALIDLYGVNEILLNDIELLKDIMEQSAKAADATILNNFFHKFGECGVTGVLILAESHISVHTWPENGYASFDIYMCGEMSTDKAVLRLMDLIQSTKQAVKIINRGLC